MSRLLAALLAAAVVLAHPGVAAGEDDAAEAKARFRKGADLYRAGKWREAIDEFEAAYRLKPHGAIHFNVAQCREKLAEWPGALRAYEDYLREVPDAKDRATVRASMKKIEERLAAAGVQALLVYTDPPGAELRLDGKPRGKTPLHTVLPPGTYALALSLDGYQPVNEDVAVSLSASRVLDLVLRPAPAGAAAAGAAAAAKAAPGQPAQPDSEGVAAGRHGGAARAPARRREAAREAARLHLDRGRRRRGRRRHRRVLRLFGEAGRGRAEVDVAAERLRRAEVRVERRVEREEGEHDVRRRRGRGRGRRHALLRGEEVLMRPLLAIGAAMLALAACKVDVEGAPCSAAGPTAECPSGQACGVDGKCSVRATECVEPAQRCNPGDRRCSPDAARTETCTTADPCGAWAFLPADVDCSATSLACSAAGASPACVCRPPDLAIVVSPAAPAGTWAPTGASQPPECKFKTLTPALAYAREWRQAHGNAPATVRVEGSPTGATPVVFWTEPLPVTVPSGVTLTNDSAPPAPALWIVSADPQAATNVVELESGAKLEGFTVRSVSATGDGIAVVCGTDTARAYATAVRVEGGGVARSGVSVQGTCGLEASGLDVRGAAGAGLLVDVTLADAAVADVGVEVTGGALSGNGGNGAEVRAGFLDVSGSASAPFDISGNQGFGVSVQARDTAGGRPYAAIDLDLAFADVSANGEAGVFLSGTSLPAAHAALASSRFHGNLGSTAASAHAAGRRAAGLLLKGTPVTLEFTGNQVFANGLPGSTVVQDQVAVFSTAKWSLSGTDCAAGANAFACPASDPSTGDLVYSSAVLTANYAQAGNAYWPLDPWPPDALLYHTVYDPICDADAARLPACP